VIGKSSFKKHVRFKFKLICHKIIIQEFVKLANVFFSEAGSDTVSTQPAWVKKKASKVKLNSSKLKLN
jgi:hypothetical protein